VFWIAYRLDKDICLRWGKPLLQDDDDMDMELPDNDPVDKLGLITLSDGTGTFNIFRTMSEFAVIESKIYKQLYSAKASQLSNEGLLHTIGELDLILEEWKEGIPTEFQPEYEIKVDNKPLLSHIIILHFAYYNCLNSIHRTSVHHGFWTSDVFNRRLNARALNPRVFSSASICVAAARASIRLIKHIEPGGCRYVWYVFTLGFMIES